MSSKDLTEWIRRAAHGDDSAFGWVHAATAPRVKAFFLRSGFSSADADDLTQDTFVRAYRSLRTFDPDRGAFSTWVGTIARNVARKRWARRKRADHFDPELAEEMFAAPENSAESPEAREERDAIRDCVSRLDEPFASIVRLRYVEGRSTRGLAAALDMPEATVRLRLREAQAMLLQCLRGKGVVS